ncbi:hypothetical protein [Botrimarina mediterranea]|uniref:PEP-CTERM protein-sorting domain-containing protein n=1 Tax=Botrimarina mediterranea TaxID=2528022 RepID=A0A518K7Y7_9BACT|nr:hypothetical protein [Botrimarina mediterranea]QDV73887.1 hypothetical protein Spa11_20860 [Botrimarina mediterranea]QDV78517.1 hypothetical protein K2D_21240 [Planctomycetes bacterium K2D]
MLTRIAKRAGVGLLLAASCLANNAFGLTFATLDVPQFQANGFRFDDFNDNFFGNFDVSNGYFALDLTEDIDLANGLFGGVGSDISADFDAETTQLEVLLRVNPDNVATNFRVVLADNDGEGVGEEYQFYIDLSSLPIGEFVTVTQQLTNPGPVFRQAGFEQADGDMIQNYGLRQVQIQSEYGSSARLNIDVQHVKVIDPELPENPLLIELTPATYTTQSQTFTFGTFSEEGVVDQTSGNFVIDTTLSPTPAEGGGIGFNGLNVSFDATEYQIEVEAKLLPNNTADSFNLVMGDNDGDDSGPGLGSDDYNFIVPTSAFNTDDFATFTLPLGTGSESSIVTTFDFENGGDGLQNFGLSQLQIQADAANTNEGLAIEIVRFSIVKIQTLEGDYNGDGIVDAADYTVWRDGNSPDDTQAGYDLWAANYGASNASPEASSVPEPAGVLILMSILAGVMACRQR